MRINLLEQKMWKKGFTLIIQMQLETGSWETHKNYKNGQFGCFKEYNYKPWGFFLFREVFVLTKKSDLHDTL